MSTTRSTALTLVFIGLINSFYLYTMEAPQSDQQLQKATSATDEIKQKSETIDKLAEQILNEAEKGAQLQLRYLNSEQEKKIKQLRTQLLQLCNNNEDQVASLLHGIDFALTFPYSNYNGLGESYYENSKKAINSQIQSNKLIIDQLSNDEQAKQKEITETTELLNKTRVKVESLLSEKNKIIQQQERTIKANAILALFGQRNKHALEQLKQEIEEQTKKDCQLLTEQVTKLSINESNPTTQLEAKIAKQKSDINKLTNLLSAIDKPRTKSFYGIPNPLQLLK